MSALTARTRALWASIAGTPVEFTPVIRVAVSPRSSLCPPGWTGIVVIDGAAITTAPDQVSARDVERALDGVPAASAADVAVLTGRLPVAEMLGPATLAYLDPGDFRPYGGDDRARPLDPAEPAVREFLAAADAVDLQESGMAEITSPAFAVTERGRVLAAAGYRAWPRDTAHLSVLTASDARGRGLARAAASAAVGHALAAGKLPQWRARPEPSRRVARALGFRDLGAQVSIRLTMDAQENSLATQASRELA